jgi:hypothetical protein
MDGWYAIVDGAADPRRYPVIAQTAQNMCLYESDFPAETRAAMAQIVALKEGERLPDLWRKHEAGRFWGIVCHSPLDLKALRRHLRKFATARLPSGDVVLFRFWDPRGFVTFAEHRTAEEVAPFFDQTDIVIADLGPQGCRRYGWSGGLQCSETTPIAPPPDASAPDASAGR